MKMWIQRTARKYGYEIRKAPFPNFQSAPIFDLAMHYLIATRTEPLTLVQVGANDGNDDSVRPYLVKYAWRAVLIEPQPDVFERLKALYVGQESRVVLENVAISNSPVALQLYKLPPGVPVADTIVSFDPKIVAKQSGGLKPQDMVAVSVPTARL